MNTSDKTKKVAIIGLGNIGKALAKNLVKGNYPVIVAARDLETSSAFAQELGDLATAKTIEEAIASAEIVIPAIYFHVIQEFIAAHHQSLKGKILVDVSNPIAPDGKGGFEKVIPADQSAGEILAALLPQDTTLVKAFGTLLAGSLENDAFASPSRKVLFYASEQESVNPIVDVLITASGFVPVRVGDLKESIRLEVFGELHEVGALGKTVTLAEV